MPQYIIEVTSKSTFGPFTAGNEAELQNRLVSGNLNMGNHLMEEGGGTSLKVKELKEPHQPKLGEDF